MSGFVHEFIRVSNTLLISSATMIMLVSVVFTVVCKRVGILKAISVSSVNCIQFAFL